MLYDSHIVYFPSFVTVKNHSCPATTFSQQKSYFGTGFQIRTYFVVEKTGDALNEIIVGIAIEIVFFFFNCF